MPFWLPTSHAQGHRYSPLSAVSVTKTHTHVFFQEFYNFSTCLGFSAPFGVTFCASCVEGIQLHLTRLAIQLSPWDLLERLELAQSTAWHLPWKALSFDVRLSFWAWVHFLWPRCSPYTSTTLLSGLYLCTRIWKEVWILRFSSFLSLFRLIWAHCISALKSAFTKICFRKESGQVFKAQFLKKFTLSCVLVCVVCICVYLRWAPLPTEPFCWPIKFFF